jgi:phosphate transport system permease protein
VIALWIDRLIRYFFGANALCAIVVLGLITIFLFREGAGFFPGNLRNLRLYRLSGQEYVDYIRGQVDDHTALSRYLQDVRQRQFNLLLKQKKSPPQAMEMLAGFDKFTADFDSAIDPLRALLSDLTDSTTAIKESAVIYYNEHKQTQPRADIAKELAPVLATRDAYEAASRELSARLGAIVASVPVLPSRQLQPRMDKIRSLTATYLQTFPAIEKKVQAWDANVPVKWYRPLTSFLFGRDWTTNSFWQDWYGVLPLLVGSVLVSMVALFVAVPLSVAAAVYVSEIASAREQRFIKPGLEFIAAIPSVVLGFFGIAVLGQTIRWITQLDCFSWVPFFPIQERLNVTTAGLLLGFMAVPTIFSLAEDALNNVPRAFKEASYALGATRLQTIVRILIPASLSGIISAALLGFGRVIGETMVVLLCAGNRIAIPDFSQGLAVLVQPVHTMTGIIAQEMGEVESGSVHYRALFMVGMLLFLLSLLINYLAQHFVRRFKVLSN